MSEFINVLADIGMAFLVILVLGGIMAVTFIVEMNQDLARQDREKEDGE